jgi:hypothetical protein
MSRRHVALRAVALLILGTWISTPAAAQPAPAGDGIHGQFFFFAAPARPPADVGSFLQLAPNAARGTLVHLGGGGEAAIGHFGVATEFGGIPHTSRGTVTTLSAYGTYHVLSQHPLHADPFFTAGYSGLFADGKQHANGVAASAGINWWFAAHRGYHPGVGVEYKLGAGADYREIRVSVRLWQ